ncbi:MAG TPA: hypothetical protein VKN99_10665 [Polyangia bacterium]|nr:hypothetical protein [Polyangia bacterium]
MKRKRVLAIAERQELLDYLGEAITAAGAEAELWPGIRSLPAGPVPHRFVFWAFDGRPDAPAALAPRLRNSAQLVAVVPQADLGSYTRLLRAQHCNHVLVADSSHFPALTIIAGKLVTGDIFGIEKYLPADAPVQLTRLRDFQGRGRAIDEILRFAEEQGVRRPVRSSIGQVCEELLMNALYDAPIDEDGRQIFAEIGPKDRVDLSSPRPVSIRYAVTEEAFAVSVRDRFGTLQKRVILDYLDKCLHATRQIDRKTYGAGLGLYLIANSATQFIVNVAPGMATEVVCTFDRKQAKAPLRMLSVFVHPGTTAARQRVG